MKTVTAEDLKHLYVPGRGSHKGQNGRLLIIGGSHLFHAASLWSLTVASRIVDLVHYCSVPENNAIVEKAKEEFRNGIVVARNDVESYIVEDDCILIGPGMDRTEETEKSTNRLLKKYPEKQWVIDAGALQMVDLSLIPSNAILTPHHGEFTSLLERAEDSTPNIDALRSQKNFDPSSVSLTSVHDQFGIEKVNPDKIFSLPAHQEIDTVRWFAKQYHCTVLLKGEKDIVCSGGACDEKICTPGECRVIEGGNAGMTKGGTGDVLAGLVAALACKNDPFLATIAGSFINKKAGDALFERVGPYFNATDLASEIPVTMKELLRAK